MSKTLFVKRPNGEFADKETGEMKTRWQDVGILLLKDNGNAAIKIDDGIQVNPGEWLQAFPKRQSAA